MMGAASIIIEDAYGREVLAQPYRKELPIGSLAKGAYTLKVMNARNMVLKKKMFLKVE